jgi:iron(II)-dependent oxidoreductase
VRQLIGNTWEWMNDELSGNWTHGELKGPSAQMKTLRGGAFNTYFESQATCQSVSGDHPSARRDNIGFRCAFSAADADAQLLEISQSA